MSLVVDGADLGNPLDVMAALADVARQGDEYPQLFALPQADDPEQPGPEYLSAVATQAQRALEDHGPALKPATRDFLDRVIGTLAD